jgi:hypothetical protein
MQPVLPTIFSSNYEDVFPETFIRLGPRLDSSHHVDFDIELMLQVILWVDAMRRFLLQFSHEEYSTNEATSTLQPYGSPHPLHVRSPCASWMSNTFRLFQARRASNDTKIPRFFIPNKRSGRCSPYILVVRVRLLSASRRPCTNVALSLVCSYFISSFIFSSHKFLMSKSSF